MDIDAADAPDDQSETQSTGKGAKIAHIQKFQYIERTSMHFKSKIFPITSLDREQSEIIMVYILWRLD